MADDDGDEGGDVDDRLAMMMVEMMVTGYAGG